LIEELNGMGAEIAHYTQGSGLDEPLADLVQAATGEQRTFGWPQMA
jgi:hypothetical protein